MTNQQRGTRTAASQLAVDRELTIASIRQSVYMARTGFFSHVWRDGTTFVAALARGRLRAAVRREHRLGLPDRDRGGRRLDGQPAATGRTS